MSSTVSSTTFYLDLIETIDINGVKQQAVKRITKNLITDYNHRILTLAANATSTLLTMGASNVGGQVSADDVSYVRVSNLDDETAIRLVINMLTAAPADAGSFHVDLPAASSYLISTKQAAIVAAGAAFAAYNTVSTIQAVTAAGSTIDVELFIISK